MNVILHDQTYKIMDIYIDDILVKFEQKGSHIENMGSFW